MKHFSASLQSVFLGIGLTLFSGALFANHYPDQIVIIGDSLSDSGNTKPSKPTIVYPHDAYSPRTDGVPWSVIIADRMKTESRLIPYVQGGTNYAYAGAETIEDLVHVPGLLEQVDFIPNSVPRRSPVFVFGGANDIFFDGIFNPDEGFVAAQNIGTILKSLNKKGFKYLISFNLPDLGMLPGIPHILDEQKTKESADFNRELINQLNDIHFSVIAIDTFSLFNEIRDNFREYGFTTVTAHPDFDTETTAGFPFWYDGVHPTQATHFIMADYVYSILSAPKGYAAMTNETFSVVRQQMSSIHQQMAPSGPCRQMCTFFPFVTGSVAPMLLSEQHEAYSKREGYGGSASLGVTNRISEGWTLGIAGSPSYSTSRNEEGPIKHRHRLTAVSGSIFAEYESQCGYVSGIANAAWLDFHKIRREFSLGPVKHEARGSTNGWDFFGQVYGTYYLWQCPDVFVMGPKGNVEFQRVNIDGYSESGARLGNLVYRDQDNNSFVTGLGWEAKFRIPMECVCMTGDVFVMFNHQWYSKDREIEIREKSLDVPAGKWPVYTPSFNYASGGINLSSTFKNNVTLEVSYQFNLGSFDIREHFVNLSLTFPL